MSPDGSSGSTEHDWRGKRVTVMGLGLFGGGLGAAEFALSQGAAVTVTDLREQETLADSLRTLAELPGQDRLRLVLGRHDDEDFTDADVVIPNPAVPAAAKSLVAARAAGTRVTSAIEILLQRLRCRVVAVTGTQGKSSTVHFTKGLLRASLPPSVRVVAGGNLGGSLLMRADGFRPEDVVVLELSSYQLEHLADAKAAIDVAAVTNIGVDHLARHKTVAAYREAKLRIASLVRADGLVILPVEEGERLAAGAAESGELASGARRLLHGDGGDVEVHDDGWIAVRGERIADGQRLAAPGAFQRANLAVAVAAAMELGAGSASMGPALGSLTGLPHRMELLGSMTTESGAIFELIDNGISTTTDSTLSALSSLSEFSGEASGGQRIVIVGGQAKRGARFDELAREARRRGCAVLPFGKAAETVAEAAKAEGAELRGQNRDGWALDAAEAARRAMEALAPDPGGAARPSTVLFSPACASFDRYPNFRARALAFRETVLAMCQPVAGTSQDSERSQTQD